MAGFHGDDKKEIGGFQTLFFQIPPIVGAAIQNVAGAAPYTGKNPEKLSISSAMEFHRSYGTMIAGFVPTTVRQTGGLANEGNKGSVLGHPQPLGIDLTGIDASFALLKVSQIFRNMRAGDVLEIRGCAPDLRSDLLRVLPATAYRLLQTEAEPASGRFHLQKC